MLESHAAVGRTRMTLLASAVEERFAFPGVRDFSDRELRAMADPMGLYQAAAGAVIFEGGSREAWRGIVAGGHVDIRKAGPNGSDWFVAPLGVGKGMGEVAL